MKVLEEHLPKQGKIFDLGCGYGIISHLMARDHPERTVVGLDVSAHRIKVAEGCIANLKFIHGDIVSFLEKCDAIIIIDTLYLLSYEDQIRVIKNCYKSLRDDGILIVKDNYKAWNWRYFYAYAEEKIKTWAGVYGRESRGREICYWPVEDFLGMMKDNGFEAKAVLSKGILPYPGVFYIARKI